MACLRIPRHLMKFVFVLCLYAHIACVVVAYIHIISILNIDYVVCIAGIYILCKTFHVCIYIRVLCEFENYFKVLLLCICVPNVSFYYREMCSFREFP